MSVAEHPAFGGVTNDDLVVCADCGVIQDKATKMLRELRERVEILQNELTVKAIQNSRLKGQQARKAEANPMYQTACGILELWQSTCSPRSKAITDTRVKLVLDRLKEWSPEELEQCVLGYAKFPYVVNRQREPMGKPSERFVKAETIFSDANRVERGIELAERGDDQMHISETLVARLSWRRVWQANRRALLRWLRHLYGELDEDGFGNMISPCPKCEQGALPLRVSTSDTGWIAQCGLCGATEMDLLQLAANYQRKATA